MRVKRPRVAVIGLDTDQVESIAHLCGDLRTAFSFEEYEAAHSLAETDVLVSGALEGLAVGGVNLLTTGPVEFDFYSYNSDELDSSWVCKVLTNEANTEREATVPTACPSLYKALAADLARQLIQIPNPYTVEVFPHTLDVDGIKLVETTSGLAAALRLILPFGEDQENSGEPAPIALFLPRVTNLAAWFRAFLADIHEINPERVPQKPPRLSQPRVWYTLGERALAERITEVTQEIDRLNKERGSLQTQLVAEGEKAEAGIRRIIWADGDDLVAAAKEVLTELGFCVEDMDAGLESGEPRREDLRLTLKNRENWEAMVEVKGYSNGTKTNDARQILDHSKKYILEKHREPDLILWLANPFRDRDPSSRPAPDSNVRDASANIEAVHVLVTDLYKQWVLVKTGRLEAQAVVQHLIDAEPGLWTPLANSD